MDGTTDVKSSVSSLERTYLLTFGFTSYGGENGPMCDKVPGLDTIVPSVFRRQMETPSPTH